MSKIVVPQCKFGIGNRVKKIMSSLKISDDIEVLWTTNFIFPYESLNEYFPDLKEVKSSAGKMRYDSWRLAILPGDTPNNFSTANQKWEKIMGSQLNPKSPKNNSIDFEYERIPQKLQDEYSTILKTIKVSDKILNEVELFHKNFDTDTVGVHIRTWKDCPKRTKMFYSFERYVQLMSKHSDKKFFVATDDKKTIEELSKEFPGRIITRDDKDLKIDAFVEMLLLSKCDNIIGSPFSTFTEIAWWYSECKSKVEIAAIDLLS